MSRPGPYAERVRRLRQEARERGEVYRTPAEQRRLERTRGSGGRRRPKAVRDQHFHVGRDGLVELDICPACDVPLVCRDPATRGRWICTVCTWYGSLPVRITVEDDGDRMAS